MSSTGFDSNFAQQTDAAYYIELMDRFLTSLIKTGNVPYLCGSPGIGKTHFIRNYARRHNLQLVEVSIASLYEASDLTGEFVPHLFKIDLNSLNPEQQAFVRNLMDRQASARLLDRGENQVEVPGLMNVPPDFLLKVIEALAASDRREGFTTLLFLDELSTATPDMQSVLQSLLLNRRLGSFRLPDGVAMITAGNPPEMVPRGADFYAALSRRVVTFHFPANFSYWSNEIQRKYEGKWIDGRLNYSRTVGDLVIGFLRRSENAHLFIQSPPSDGCGDAYSEEKKLCNPASWEQLIGRLTLYEEKCLERGVSPVEDRSLLYRVIRCGLHDAAAGPMRDYFVNNYRKPSLNLSDFNESLSRLPLNKRIHDRLVKEFLRSLNDPEKISLFRPNGSEIIRSIRDKYAEHGWDLKDISGDLKRAGKLFSGPGEASGVELDVPASGADVGTTLGCEPLISDVGDLTESMLRMEVLFDISLANDQPPMLYGPPGVGKSTFIETYAARHGYALVVLDISQCSSETSLSGLRAPQEHKVDFQNKLAVQLFHALHSITTEPLMRISLDTRKTLTSMETFMDPTLQETLYLSSDPKRKVLLVVEELTNATEGMMSVLMSLLYEKRIGRFHLPPNVKLAATGNYPEQVPRGGLFFRAFDRRLVDFDFPVDFEYWRRDVERRLAPEDMWALHLVSNYLRSLVRTEVDPSTSPAFNSNNREGVNQNNPAQWKRIIDVMAQINRDAPEHLEPLVKCLVSSTLDEQTAQSFFNFFLQERQFSISDIIEKGVMTKMPHRHDQVVMLVQHGVNRLAGLVNDVNSLNEKLNPNNRRSSPNDYKSLMKQKLNAQNLLIKIVGNFEKALEYYENIYRRSQSAHQNLRASQLLAPSRSVIRDILTEYAAYRNISLGALADEIPVIWEASKVAENLHQTYHNVHRGMDQETPGRPRMI